jgi:hypothetical protein
MDEGRAKPPPHDTPPAKGPRAEREARLAKALRDNLRRRKGAGQGDRSEPSED